MNRNLKSINIVSLVFAVLLIGLFSGCSSKVIEDNKESVTAQKKASYSRIAPQEVKKKLDSEKGIILLDVRTKEEYLTGHIKGSMLLPVDILKEEAEKNLKDREVTIFVYCRSGNRSATAAKILANLGYKNVYDMGGIIDWPYEVEK
jgi:phage shock protein E